MTSFLVFVVTPVVAAFSLLLLVARWDDRRDHKTPRHQSGSRRGARAGDRLREHWRSLPATITRPFRRDLTDEEQEWAAVLDDITAEQARNRQYPIVTNSPAGTSPDVPAGDAPGPVKNTRRDGPQPAVPAPDPGAPWLPALPPPVRHADTALWLGTETHEEVMSREPAAPGALPLHDVPGRAHVTGAGQGWHGAPLASVPRLDHDEYGPDQRWAPRPGRAVRAPGALMHPLLPAVIVLRRIILAVEPAATKPAVWEHDTGWNTITAIDADIAAKADAS